MIAAWFLLGGAVGTANWISQRRTVMRLLPEAPSRAKARVLGGALARWSLAAIVLAAAFGQESHAGMAAFAGLWVARWLMIIHLDFHPLQPLEPDHLEARS